MTIVSPSLLAADFLHLDSDIEMINRSEAEWLHLDVMDGVFVPNISFGFPVLEAVAKKCTKALDVHFMIVHPEQYIKQTAKLGAMMMNVHYEACTHLHRTIQEIHDAGMKAGVTLNPSTPVCVLEDIIKDVDMVLLMSVNPGFGGQTFIENTIDKVKRLRQLIEEKGSKALIEVDGGVQGETAPRLVAAGVDVLVSGSYVFKSATPEAVIHCAAWTAVDAAEEEENKIIAQGNAPLNDDGSFIRDKVKARQDADYPVVPPSEVELMDVSPQQIASIAAALIPLPLKPSTALTFP